MELWPGRLSSHRQRFLRPLTFGHHLSRCILAGKGCVYLILTAASDALCINAYLRQFSMECTSFFVNANAGDKIISMLEIISEYVYLPKNGGAFELYQACYQVHKFENVQD